MQRFGKNLVTEEIKASKNKAIIIRLERDVTFHLYFVYVIIIQKNLYY